MKIAIGFCQCGCGRRTRLAPQTDKKKKWIYGQPLRFCLGHNGEAQKEEIRLRNSTHRMTNTPEYRAYTTAKSRCENPHRWSYKYYGAVGVRFLFKSFEEFFSELGPKPKGTTLGRFGDEGHYEPKNCAWQTKKQQLAEKRKKFLKQAA